MYHPLSSANDVMKSRRFAAVDVKGQKFWPAYSPISNQIGEANMARYAQSVVNDYE